MKSFRGGYIERAPITHHVLQAVRVLGEYKGRHTRFAAQIPQALETLRQAALIQSTESSNRIEGIVASSDRFQAIVVRRSEPRDRPEQEIAGYRDALDRIHQRHAELAPTPDLALDLHRTLFRYAPREGGNWKHTDNSIAEIQPDGSRVAGFQPVLAAQTPFYMRALHEEMDARWEAGDVDRLLLISAYILDFLCIHPFSVGNGRMARLLTLLLHYRAGYDVGRYVSLERLVEGTRAEYHAALHRSSQGWHEAQHDLLPWTEYLLGILTAAYREFEERVEGFVSNRGVKTLAVEQAIVSLPDCFRISDVEGLCPQVSREMIRVVLNRLREQGQLAMEETGRAVAWRKRGNNS